MSDPESFRGSDSFITNCKDKLRSEIFQIITVCYITFFFYRSVAEIVRISLDTA